MTSRRSFLAAAGLTAAAPALARPFVRTAPRSGKEPVVIGSGEHRYIVNHDWARIPDGYALGNTHGVCEDSQGRIYIKHTVHASSKNTNAVLVFDHEGKFIESWGPDYKGGAHGLHIQKEPGGEFLYLADPNRGLVQKTSLKGEPVFTLKCPTDSGLYADPAQYKPTNIAVAPTGDFYVADGYGLSWIHHYNHKAEYVRSFAGPGNQLGQCSCPHGIWCDTRSPTPTLIVADRSNHRLHRFSLDGACLGVVTDELRLPCHFHTREGLLLIPDLQARVTIFDRDNRLVTHLGDGENMDLRDKPRDQFIPGKFICPHGAIFDHAGDIFVVEWVEVGRITKLTRAH